MVVRARTRMTEEEFMSLPESHDHIELIDGEVVLSPSPMPIHQILILNLGIVLKAWARSNRPSFVGLSPLDLRLGPDRIVQPDLFIVAAGIDRTRLPVTAVPELAIEVISDRASYDRHTKRALYADAGIAEYWILDPLDRTMEQFEGMNSHGVFRDRIVSFALPGLVVEIPELFED